MKLIKILLLLFIIMFLLSCDVNDLINIIDRIVDIPAVLSDPEFLFDEVSDPEKLRPGISIRFSMSMDSTSVEAHTSLKRGGYIDVEIAKSWHDNNQVLQLLPESDLARNNSYSISIKKQAMSQQKVGLSEDYSYSFIVNFLAPRVLGSIPSDGTMDHPDYNTVTIIFNKEMDPDSVRKENNDGTHSGAFSLYPSGQKDNPLPGVGSWVGENFIFKTTSYMEVFQSYTIEVSREARDIFGKYMDEPYLAQFQVYGEYKSIRNYPVDTVLGIDLLEIYDGSYNLYAINGNLNEIVTYESNGSFIERWPVAYETSYPWNPAIDIKIDDREEIPSIYLLSKDDHRVLVYDSGGGWYGWFGKGEWHDWEDTLEPGPGQGSDDFAYPEALAFDSTGYLYIADTGNHRIQKLKITGHALEFVDQFGIYGSEPGEFNSPKGLALDEDGNIYIADTGNHRIQKFDSNYNFLFSRGVQGTGKGEFTDPRGIAIEQNQYIYVVDSGNYRIQKFDLSGNYVTQWGQKGNGPGEFETPLFLAVDDLGEIYVSDPGNNRVTAFKVVQGDTNP
ncbi:MAG: Ig-like domain-containing protein [Spirochaetales bacterium]|nr:Ig-like domain-containing protein [Spirochaetales bacterium]